MPNVRMALKRNYLQSRGSKFIAAIDEEIRIKRVKILRIHASGDFYDLAYLRKWQAIARLNPTVRFYAYTKMVRMVQAETLPHNLVVIFSYGGKEDSFIKPTDRHSQVFATKADMKKAKYKDTTTNDINAIGKSKKIGLVYHGAKSKQFDSINP